MGRPDGHTFEWFSCEAINRGEDIQVGSGNRLVNWLLRVMTRLGLGASYRQVSFPASTLAETPGDINASGPLTVEPAYLVQLDKDDTTPYDVALSAPFTVS
jgi:hypothetical protein